jgi:hypothetical protein
MILKDASAYNIQFLNNMPVLIDTLSFDRFQEGQPWIAYGQFCRHFLAPLLLISCLDLRLSKLMQSFIDGIPIDLADTMLHGKGGFFKYQHIHLHARACTQYSKDSKRNTNTVTISKNAIIALVQSLINNIERISLKNEITGWSDYYNQTNYLKVSSDSKETIIKNYFEKIGKIHYVWDLGANDGRYSRLAIRQGSHIVAFDLDPIAVDRNYNKALHFHEAILPLILDLTAPSPAIGFANRERLTIGERQKPDIIMMLAIIHHMAISNNLPFNMIAQWVSEQCTYLIIEFIPKEDSQVQILLKTREDIFPWYTEQCFSSAFLCYFELLEKNNIENSKRILYLFKNLNPPPHS